MRKKLIARTAKLLSESKRGRRHQGIAVAYEHIPNDLDERNHGSIYAVINVNAPAASAEEVTELIVDAFHGEYYQDLGKDPLASFEAALARVNEELAEITHQGNIHWLNNLNAVLAVLTDTTLHVTQTGKAEAFLYRNSRSSQITTDLAGDNVNPLRTFINIATGELLEGDKVAMATPGVFFHVSKDELQKYVEEFQPKVAISHLADLVESNTGEVQPNSILIIEAITPEAASEETLTDINDEVWITEQAKPMQTAIEASAPFAQKALYYIKKYWEATIAFVTLTALPKVGEAFTGAKDFAGTLIDKEKAPKPVKKDKVIEETSESIISEGGKEDLEDITVNEKSNELIDEPISDSGNVIRIKETSNKPKWLKLEKINLSLGGKFKEDVQKITGGLFKKKRTVLIVAVIAVILLSLGIFGIWKTRETAETNKLAEASYTEAQSKLDIGKTQLASGDNAAAAQTLNSALVITTNLEKNPTYKDKATTLASSVQTTLDTAEGIVRVSPVQLADTASITGKNILGPYKIGTSLYAISKDNGSIAAVDTKSGESSNVLDKPSIDGKFVAATTVPTRSVLVLFTDKGSVYEFDTKDVQLNKQSTSGDVETPSAIASFSTNIYSVDKENGKIYKRLKTTGGYGARSEYIVDGSNVKGAIGIAIDSSIFALKPNGEVDKYISGKKQSYSLTNMPFAINSANSIFTNEDTKGLYITEGAANRIIRIDNQGKFINQYVSDGYKNMATVNVDDVAKIIYSAAEGKVAKINE